MRKFRRKTSIGDARSGRESGEGRHQTVEVQTQGRLFVGGSQVQKEGEQKKRHRDG